MTGTLDPSDALAELVVIEAGCVPEVDYSHRPNDWLGEFLDEWAWRLQREIWGKVSVARSHTAVLSCNNSGKTWLAARIVVWFILTHWRQGVRVVTTAPTAAQVTLLLWQEIRAAFTKARERQGAKGTLKVPGKIIGSPYPQWKIGEAVVGFGRKPADHEQSALQGIHAPWVLAVVDEAGGVGQPIYDALSKIMTNKNARVLLIGNPDVKASPFGRACEPGSGWDVVRVDGLRTPNFTEETITSGKYPFTHALMVHEGIPFNDEPIPAELEEIVRTNLLTPEWVEERFVHYCGLDPKLAEVHTLEQLGQIAADATHGSQRFTADVRGDFPDAEGNSVIPLGWVRRAQERWRDWYTGHPAQPDLKRRAVPPQADQPGVRIIGQDVATTNGADDTVIAVRQGLVIYGVHVYPDVGADPTIGNAEKTLEHLGGNPATAMAVVDGIGIGSGVITYLRRVHGLTVVNFEAYRQSDRRSQDGQFRFSSDRAAAWWHLRELLHPVTGLPIALPPDSQLEQELTTPTWRVRSSAAGGIIQVESKDDIRKRLKHSTDRADAVIHAFWVDGQSPNSEGTPETRLLYGQPGEATARPSGTLPPGGEGGAIAYTLPTLDDLEEERDPWQ